MSGGGSVIRRQSGSRMRNGAGAGMGPADTEFFCGGSAHPGSRSIAAYRDPSLEVLARSRSSACRSSGVSAGPKSSASNTWRISTMPSRNGTRLTHSMASSLDFTWTSQKPATSSLVSANGPSTTLRWSPEKNTRAPLELACRPSPASITPALTSSSLNFPISASSSWVGSTPASVSLLAFTISMNRMARVSSLGVGTRRRLRAGGSTKASNGPTGFRQASAPRHGPDDQVGLDSGGHGLRQGGIHRFMREVLLAGEEPDEGPALAGDLVADGALEHRVGRFQRVQHGAAGGRPVHRERDLAVQPRQGAQVGREHHPDHASDWTSTESTAGRSRTMGVQLSPPSREAYTCPPVVPKYTPQGSSRSTAMASRSTFT